MRGGNSKKQWEKQWPISKMDPRSDLVLGHGLERPNNKGEPKGTDPESVNHENDHVPVLVADGCSVSKLDLGEGLPREDLGLGGVEELGIQKDFIGLQENKVIVDYSSPKVNGTDLYGITLSEDDLQTCKKSWLLYDGGNSSNMDTLPKWDGNGGDTQNHTSNYFVLFPPEEDEKLRSFIDDSRLMDMEMKEGRFTLFSNPKQGVVTREKIDRVLVNANWRFLFPHATVTALLTIYSDHSFKYELIWDEHPECREVVQRGWDEDRDEEWDRLMRILDFFMLLQCKGDGVTGLLESRMMVEIGYLAKKKIMRAVVQHYSSVYTAESVSGLDQCVEALPVIVSDELNKKLCAGVSDEEIKKAVDGLGSLKALGPDELNGQFYKSYWDVIGQDVCAAIRNFFLTGFLPNETLIALVPKVDCLETFS
ncbi:Endonuclease/exonuclease/phosphatase superfamily [Sesbania bispinosa]|nr:Endonuclease/exonuclease/phosphatase superfamily [Sesbania bispinosa]